MLSKEEISSVILNWLIENKIRILVDDGTEEMAGMFKAEVAKGLAEIITEAEAKKPELKVGDIYCSGCFVKLESEDEVHRCKAEAKSSPDVFNQVADAVRPVSKEELSSDYPLLNEPIPTEQMQPVIDLLSEPDGEINALISEIDNLDRIEHEMPRTGGATNDYVNINDVISIIKKYTAEYEKGGE